MKKRIEDEGLLGFVVLFRWSMSVCRVSVFAGFRPPDDANQNERNGHQGCTRWRRTETCMCRQDWKVIGTYYLHSLERPTILFIKAI